MTAISSTIPSGYSLSFFCPALKTSPLPAQAEVFVLAYTEELLAAQEAGLNQSIKQTAKKHGVAGFTDVANDLEKVWGCWVFVQI